MGKDIETLENNINTIFDIKPIEENNTYLANVNKYIQANENLKASIDNVNAIKNNPFKNIEEIRKLSDINTVFENGLTLFIRMLEVSAEGINTSPKQSTLPNQENTPNTTNPAPTTNQNDDDLAILDRVYDEVMHKNNPDILKTFSKQKLAYIRNTLFAKKGYIFTKPEYARYFSQKSWYNGRYNTQDLLNEEEKRFIAIFKQYEK